MVCLAGRLERRQTRRRNRGSDGSYRALRGERREVRMKRATVYMG